MLCAHYINLQLLSQESHHFTGSNSLYTFFVEYIKKVPSHTANHKSGTWNYTYCQPLISYPNPLAPHMESVIQQVLRKQSMVKIYSIKVMQTGLGFACTTYVIFGFKVMFSDTSYYTKTGNQEGQKKPHHSLYSVYRGINIFCWWFGPIFYVFIFLDCTKIAWKSIGQQRTWLTVREPMHPWVWNFETHIL